MTERNTATMTPEQAGLVCMPLGNLYGWRLSAIAAKRPVTFCRIMRCRRRYYGDLRDALDVMFNGPLHKGAKREKATHDQARRDREMVDRARL